MLHDIKQDLQRTDADGILQVYDASRTKWLSAARPVYGFGIDHLNASGFRYMKVSGNVVSRGTGYKLFRNATITGLSIQTGASGTGSFRIDVLRSGSPVTIHTESLTTQDSKTVTGLNLDILADDALMAILVTGTFNYPVLTLEIAWR